MAPVARHAYTGFPELPARAAVPPYIASIPACASEAVGLAVQTMQSYANFTVGGVARGMSYALNQNVIFAMTELPGGDTSRSKVVHPLLMTKPAVTWRNDQASLDVAELKPRTRSMSTRSLSTASSAGTGLRNWRSAPGPER